MLRRQVVPLIVVVIAACALAPAAASGATSSKAGQVTICQEHHYRVVTGAAARRYVIENGNFGGRPECITNQGLRPNFTITRSAADSRNGEPAAYPFALYGCSWSVCTPGSQLPARVKSVRHASATWYIGGHAAGRWNAAFDVWFGRHHSALHGQAKGAELMIWLTAREYPAEPSTVITVDHRRWYVYHWVTSFHGSHWNYVQVRAVRPTRHVRSLALLPIIHRVQKMGLIKPWWWMLNVESGFEIWHGGRGLQTKWFAAAVRV
jgi:Glycosyl hydrolase family 12